MLGLSPGLETGEFVCLFMFMYMCSILYIYVCVYDIDLWMLDFTADERCGEWARGCCEGVVAMCWD